MESGYAENAEFAAMRDERNAAARFETGIAKASVEISVESLGFNMHEERFARGKGHPGNSLREGSSALFNKGLIIRKVVGVCAQLVELRVVKRETYKVVLNAAHAGRYDLYKFS